VKPACCKNGCFTGSFVPQKHGLKRGKLGLQRAHHNRLTFLACPRELKNYEIQSRISAFRYRSLLPANPGTVREPGILAVAPATADLQREEKQAPRRHAQKRRRGSAGATSKRPGTSK